MASLTIRNLDDNLKIQLRLRAAQHGTSMEAEVRTILYQSLSSASSGKSFADRYNLKKENDDRRNELNKDIDLLIAADNAKTLNMSKRLKQLIT